MYVRDYFGKLVYVNKYDFVNDIEFHKYVISLKQKPC